MKAIVQKRVYRTAVHIVMLYRHSFRYAVTSVHSKSYRTYSTPTHLVAICYIEYSARMIYLIEPGPHGKVRRSLPKGDLRFKRGSFKYQTPAERMPRPRRSRKCRIASGCMDGSEPHLS